MFLILKKSTKLYCKCLEISVIIILILPPYNLGFSVKENGHYVGGMRCEKDNNYFCLLNFCVCLFVSNILGVLLHKSFIVYLAILFFYSAMKGMLFSQPLIYLDTLVVDLFHTGAVGCSLLAYIIPCAVHMKVKWANLSDENKVKDILIIGFSIVVSILTMVAIIQQFINGSVI